MNTQSKLLLTVAALLALVPHMGIGSGNAANVACSGQFKNCSVGSQGATGGTTSAAIGLNAVGDKVTYNIGNFKANDSFGNVTIEMTKSLQLPDAHADLLKSIRLYAFTPTVGSRLIKNKQQQLLFVAFDLEKELPSWTPNVVKAELATVKSTSPWAKRAVYVYHHVAGEPANQWTELGKAVTGATNLANDAVKFTLTPDAKVTIQLPEVKDADGSMITPEPITGDLAVIR